jgi:hypothetical protein
VTETGSVIAVRPERSVERDGGDAWWSSKPTAPPECMRSPWKSVTGLPVTNGVGAARRPSYTLVR